MSIADMSKEALLDLSIERAKRFCEVNALPQPKFQVFAGQEFYYERLCGCYKPDLREVWINLSKCRAPSRSGWAWTWPGYKADLTPLGVTAHELGHHWHHVFDPRYRSLARWFQNETAGEKPLTGYEPNVGESIAESFKVFVNNPTLLAALRPRRHSFFVTRGLRPIVTAHWREVLVDSPRHVAAVERALKIERPLSVIDEAALAAAEADVRARIERIKDKLIKDRLALAPRGRGGEV